MTDANANRQDFEDQQAPNTAQQTENFAADAAIDTSADGFINRALNEAASFIPGGQSVEPMLQTEIDQDANNVINTEVNKGVDGVMKDIEGFFGGRQ